jgi:preprotein translocase subunit SecD
VSRLGIRAGTLLAALLLFGFYAIANFVPKEQRIDSPVLPDKGLRLGLDLRGGIHWVLGVELDVRVKHELDTLSDRLEADLEDDGLKVESRSVTDGQLIINASGGARSAAEQWATDTGVLDKTGDSPLAYELTDRWRKEVRENAMAQVLEVLRKRIADPIQGIPDSVVTRQGDDRVLVQIPGGQIDRSSARKLLNSTGFLEFKIVQDVEPTEELLLAKYDGEMPPGTEFAFERDRESGRVINAYLVPETPDTTGAFLKAARMNFANSAKAA